MNVTRATFDDVMVLTITQQVWYLFEVKVHAYGIKMELEYIDFAGGIAVNVLGHTVTQSL